MNEIVIVSLEVHAHVGVPDEERARPQRLVLNITLTPAAAFEQMSDEIAQTVDYELAARRVVEIASEHPRKLIETLAADIAATLLAEFPVRKVAVEVRKFILPQTEYVAVRCVRER